MPIFAPKWVFSRFTTWIFGGVRILLVGQCISKAAVDLFLKVSAFYDGMLFNQL